VIRRDSIAAAARRLADWRGREQRADAIEDAAGQRALRL
jgi:hypothetical protein